MNYKVDDQIRLKQMKTRVGLKRKLRNDLWSEPKRITKVISPENVEIESKKIVNVNNIKKKEPDREVIRNEPTITRSGRIAKPRFKE